MAHSARRCGLAVLGVAVLGLAVLGLAVLGLAVLGLAASVTVAAAAGDLSRQEPIEVTVELGRPGQQAFLPNRLRFETGKLYKLMLTQSEQRSALLHLARVHAAHLHAQGPGVQERDGKMATLAEFKGAIREIEVYPGQIAEWWFVPVAAGRVTDLRCGIIGADGKSHAEHGMVGEIVIE